MKRFFTLIFSAVTCWASGQTAITPVITPTIFQYNTTITVTYDVTGTSLANLTDAYAWVWSPNPTIDAKSNVNPASNNTTLTNAAKFTKSVVGTTTKFTLTFKPSDFFTQDISARTQMGILLKGNDWSNGKTTDYLAPLGFQVTLVSPTASPLFVATNDNIAIQATTPIAADFKLYVNNGSTPVNQQNGITTYNYNHLVTETSGSVTIKIVATTATSSAETSFQYVISQASPVAPRPAGIISGINYNPSDPTKVTLCLLAPGKSSVFVRGDFSDWDWLPQYIMNKDGEYFWIELSGLTSGQEYGFQYLVNESVIMADPYADKILDTDDQYIPAATYPNLKPFPTKALNSKWYFNRVAVFQTNQTPYDWQIEDFEAPEKKKLVIYELLIRDFFANGQRNYQNLIDTLGYFKRLGINAIELMPVMEFNGNEGWGYNPTFMFAPDKYYGTKDKFKEFIDACHQNDIAVILDIAMNHHDVPNPYVMMDFNFTTFKPTAANKWFNVDAKHPYNVFFDMNHESAYTKNYLDTITYHWLNEYKVDGFRFDLSKGFTQNTRCGGSTSNEGCIAERDVSRIAILKRMADAMWEHTPDAIVILEHFCANEEEKELAEYRAAEGKGMMLWGNLNYAYNQNTMGFGSGSDLSWIQYNTRTWSVPHVVGYMESHDEERLMYKNKMNGGTAGDYNVKEINTGLLRMKAASVLFYTIPGPKMVWQFGELGYDYSINQCENGTISNDCRLSPKPIEWDYQEDPHRSSLFQFIAELISLRNTYPVFTEGTSTMAGGVTLLKQATIKSNPYTATPANANQMNVQVAVNFDLTDQSVNVAFPHDGTWYDYYNGGRAIQVTGATHTMRFAAGQFKIFTDYNIAPSVVTSVDEVLPDSKINIYPNPTQATLMATVKGAKILDAWVYTQQGIKMKVSKVDSDTWDVSQLKRGFYIVEFRTSAGVIRKKIVKE